MHKMNNPHDKLFKETFTDVAVTKDFVRNYFPKSVLSVMDVESLELLNDSFIQDRLVDTRSDLLCQVKMNENPAYLYFLFEHKSFKEKNIALQLLGYMLEIWNRELEKAGATELPIIIPLLLYHGKEKWDNPQTIGDLVDGDKELSPELKEYIPDFTFIYYDFSVHGDEEVKGDVKLQAYLQLVKHIFTRDWAVLINVIVKIDSLLTGKYHVYFETILLYVYAFRDHIPVEKLKEKLTVEGRKRLMTAAERLIQEGELKGELKEKRETARKLLALNMELAQIAKVTELSIEEIKQIADDM